MNPIISSELTLFAKELQRFLSPLVLQETAKQMGFVQRSSKYQVAELIALCVWLSQEVASTSLTQLCSRLEASLACLVFKNKVVLEQYHFVLLIYVVSLMGMGLLRQSFFLWH